MNNVAVSRVMQHKDELEGRIKNLLLTSYPDARLGYFMVLLKPLSILFLSLFSSYPILHSCNMKDELERSFGILYGPFVSCPPPILHSLPLPTPFPRSLLLLT